MLADFHNTFTVAVIITFYRPIKHCRAKRECSNCVVYPVLTDSILRCRECGPDASVKINGT